jgi:sigma-B regulation protein RsbU (phosphoserine phosphatase)
MNLLLVDDEQKYLEIVRHNLVKLGYAVEVAQSGEEGLAKMLSASASGARPFRIVICDWSMPGMDGAALCRAVRATPSLAHAYVIMLTGRTGADDKLDGLYAGADDYLAKPFRLADLLTSIRTAERVLSKPDRPGRAPGAGEARRLPSRNVATERA